MEASLIITVEIFVANVCSGKDIRLVIETGTGIMKNRKSNGNISDMKTSLPKLYRMRQIKDDTIEIRIATVTAPA
jgi:hypothetical protein